MVVLNILPDHCLIENYSKKMIQLTLFILGWKNTLVLWSILSSVHPVQHISLIFIAVGALHTNIIQINFSPFRVPEVALIFQTWYTFILWVSSPLWLGNLVPPGLTLRKWCWPKSMVTPEAWSIYYKRHAQHAAYSPELKKRCDHSNR